jgi:hypothetical protein
MNEAVVAGGGDRFTFPVRVLIALTQAGALYWLTGTLTAAPSWPASEPSVFIPLLLACSYVPLILMLGMGQIRPLPLVIWAAIAAVVIIGLGYHDATRGGFGAVFWPRFELWLVLAAVAFVAHVLVVDTVIERRAIPPYTRHFDTAWKLGVQIVLAVGFVLILWGVLLLGAGLFKLVGIDFFQRLIAERWFRYPATTLAIAVAIHVTDVQPALIRGARMLALSLLSWLLPLLVVILLGFLGSLPFVSLDPLWRTGHATALLLVAAGLLVFLINSSYQDGASGAAAAANGSGTRIKHFAASAGAIGLIPLVALAAWALSLRVAQHGWSVERIFAAAVIVVAGCYASGYAIAVALSPSTLKRIEITNFITAYVFLILALALFSPIADPARLMVADQVARLKSGAIAPNKFDFTALKFDGAGWGHDALLALSQNKDGPDAATISALAARALAAPTRYGTIVPNGTQQSDADMAARITVYPVGRALPAGFLDLVSGPFNAMTLPPCVRMTRGKTCIARYVTLAPSKSEAILFLDIGAAYILQPDVAGHWHQTGRLSGPLYCAAVRGALERGDFSVEPHATPDLVVGAVRLDIDPPPVRCPN